MEQTTLNTLKKDIPVFSPDDIDIPYVEFTLPNGLRLIVHEDHKAPIVAVNVWYHVGSKNEMPGKTGLAHLFEHLMFNGSEHFNDDYFQALQAIGATDLNGTTSHDRTNYFQNVPVSALDQVLWLESDRMGHLLGAVDMDKLEEQRGVVLNEKKQSENEPYGREMEIVMREMFSAGHPYSWPVIGVTEDVERLTLDDVHGWFRSYYGAANAVLVIAGDVDPQDTYHRVVKYFGHIPPGPTIVRPALNIPWRASSTRTTYQDRVPEARITIVWNSPQTGSAESAHLHLAAAILGSGKNAILYKDLVYERRIASHTSAYQWAKEISGNFIIDANAMPGESITEVEQRIESILAGFLENGPDARALQRVKAQHFARFMKGVERIGGFGGKSDVLAASAVFGGSPDAYQRLNRFIADATTDDILKSCRKWLSQGRFTLVCTPFPEYAVHPPAVKRTEGLPALEKTVSGRFPDLQRTSLSNGLEVILASRPGVPTTVVQMLFRAGYATDGNAAGLAQLSMGMLDEGTRNYTALELNERLQLIGATLNCGAGLDHSFVTMHTLSHSLDQSLALFGEVILHPAFPESEFTRLRQQQIAAIQREKVTPMQMALRVMPQLLYGSGHPYAQPMTGTGTEEALMNFTVDDIRRFYKTWLHPNNAMLIVAGDITLEELKEKLEITLGEWQQGALAPRPSFVSLPQPANVLYLLDRPESLQSIVIGGYLTKPYGEVPEIALARMNDVLGGQFISRINLNLREDKHWTYGARTLIVDTAAERPLLAFASVQMDKTNESIAEIIGEFTRFVGVKPVTAEEFIKCQTNAILALPGQWETNAAVASSVMHLVVHHLPDDYFQHYGQRVYELTLEEVHSVSRKIVDPEKLCWFIVGDAEKILPSLNEMQFDAIVRLDGDGHRME